MSLTRRFGLVEATALNMINMIGIGPFITIPLLMTALGGPQAMLGWIFGAAIWTEHDISSNVLLRCYYDFAIPPVRRNGR